jgi:hypothetical protein
MPVVCGRVPCAAWVAGGRFRAALQLECERWYIGAAAPEGGGLGGRAGRDGAAYVGAAAPNVRHLRGCLTLGRLGDKVTLDGGLGRQRQWC